MLFNSYEYIFIFLPVTFLVYFYLNHKRITKVGTGFLVFSSLFFYSWWNIVYLPLILGSMIFNYIVGNQLLNSYEKKAKESYKKCFLAFGIIANISLLGYFKYSDFCISNINYAFDADLSLLSLSLPLAISFFTFQQIAYLVDSYRGETKGYRFLNYAAFVSFFPQLIAGPIVLHSEMMPQFANIRNKVINYHHISHGLFIFSIGLFKKVVIADYFAIWATNGFDTAVQLNMIEAWTTSLSYSFQLYFDFSGYTDMAIGAALLFNIKLPVNFNSPYKATNIQDFWRKWHITLSRFFRDYVYIPLGGNRKSEIKTYTNLFSIFLIGGLWHGAGWTFVFWGILHGMAIIIHRTWRNFGFKMNSVLAWFITFNFINVAWVFFRAKEFEDAIKVLQGMFSVNIVLPIALSNSLEFLNHFGVEFGPWLEQIHCSFHTVILLGIVLFVSLFAKNSMQQLNCLKFNTASSFYVAFLLITTLSFMNKISHFLYFNF